MNRKNHLNRDFWVHFKTWIHIKVLNLPGFCLCILMTWFHYDIVDGEWSLWTKWSMCNVTCAGGLQHRYRICTLTAHGGSDCNGTAEEYTECNTDPCPVVSELHWGYSQHKGKAAWGGIECILNKAKIKYEYSDDGKGVIELNEIKGIFYKCI